MDKTPGDQDKITSKDLVLQEVWRAKDALAAAYGYDLDKFVADMRKQEKRSGHRVISLQKKREA